MGEEVRLDGRVAVVTGATAGIGRAIAFDLARRGAEVVVVGRNPAKGRAAVDAIRASVPGAAVGLALGDLASLEEVRALAEEILDRWSRLDLLVNNAGVFSERRETTRDGFELHFGVNHLAPFALTLRLLDRLERTPSSRVVNVSSFAHRYATIDFSDLQSERSGSALAAYNRSKLANVLFTRELARRVAPAGPVVHAADPGPVRSDLNPRRGLLGFGTKLVRPFLPSPERGARTPLLAATGPEFGRSTGLYLSGGKERRPGRQARDDRAALGLWNASVELVGLGSPVASPA